jgi:polyisoprenoid-binding protein YceI
MRTKHTARDCGERLTLAVLVVLLAATSQAAELPSWRIERADVRITVPLKPGGAFAATTSSLGGTLTLHGEKPARLGGEIVMDLATIDTGISLRSQHLRERYLEVTKGPGFDKAVLSEIHLSGVESETFDGTTGFTGTLLLHGVKGEVSGKAEIHHEGSGSGRRVRAEFPLTLTDFAITPPEYLGVGVANKLLVKVSFMAMPGRQAGN